MTDQTTTQPETAEQRRKRLVKTVASVIPGVDALDGSAGVDNLAIALCSYFESHLLCPDEEEGDDYWNPWAVEQYKALIAKIANAAVDAIIAYDRAAGCDPEAMRAEIKRLKNAVAREHALHVENVNSVSARLAVTAEALERAQGMDSSIDATPGRNREVMMGDFARLAADALADLPARAAALLRVVEAARGIDLLFYKEGGYPSWNVGRGRHLDQRAPELRSALRALDGEASHG